MTYEVILTDDAALDLDELIEYVDQHDGPLRADQLLSRIESVLSNLATLPDRASIPRELSVVGIREYRQVFFKPYRLIYRVEKSRVHVYLIVDGRRDLQALLSRRLFR